MEPENATFPAVEWYKELEMIRECCSVAESYLLKIDDFKRKAFSSITKMSNRDLIEMFELLLLSYPILVKGHKQVWEELRQECERLVATGDRERCVICYNACIFAVVNDDELEYLKNVDDPDYKEFSTIFDYMDKVITLKDNKGKSPFNLIQYDDERLTNVVKAVKEIDIAHLIRLWNIFSPSAVYPEGYELYNLCFMGEKGSSHL